MSLNRILNMARAGMNAQQTAIQIASQNISNAENTGYSRQRVELAASLPTLFPYGNVGTGVDIKSVTRARDALLTEALAVEEDIEENKPAEDLLGVDGMDETTAFALAEHGVITRENLADLATDELMELAIDGMDEDRARALIMAARVGQTA